MEQFKTIHISIQNRKLGASIPSINLPAVTTCRANAPCRKGCYACKGTFLYSTVQKSMQNNLEIYKISPKAYFSQIQGYLQMIPFKHFRYHSSGDIVDMQYLELMVETAKKCKETKFLCFTKKYEIVNEYLTKHKLPKNLNIVFSSWGAFIPENPHNLPMTYVKFGKENIDKFIPANAVECSGKCETCFACWNLKKKQSIYFNKH
jgi:hypothetical protein